MQARQESRLEVTVDISPDLGRKLSRVGAVLTQRYGKRCSFEDALDAMAEIALHKLDPLRKAKAKSPEPTPRAKVAPRRETQPVVPSHLKIQALRRDRNQCTHARDGRGRCGNRKRVDTFPVREIAGRSPALRDIATLCRHHSPKQT